MNARYFFIIVFTESSAKLFRPATRHISTEDLKKSDFEQLTNFFKLSGLLSETFKYQVHKVANKQKGKEDCGIYCAIYARNIMTGEKHEYDEQTWKETRRLICQSIYMNRDLRIADELEIMARAEDLLDLECVPCKKSAPSREAKKDHDEANHTEDGLFLCNHCNKRVEHLMIHSLKCRPKPVNKVNPFATMFMKSTWKTQYEICMKSPVLRPLKLFRTLTVEQVQQKSETR